MPLLIVFRGGPADASFAFGEGTPKEFVPPETATVKVSTEDCREGVIKELCPRPIFDGAALYKRSECEDGVAVYDFMEIDLGN